jgi:hypothetical protein
MFTNGAKANQKRGAEIRQNPLKRCERAKNGA